MPFVSFKIVFPYFLTIFTVSLCSDNIVIREENSAIPRIAEYFSTKGRYEEVNPHLIEDILSVNKSNLQLPSEQCREIHLTAIIRHGTRYPTTRNVKKMRKLYELVMSKASASHSWLREIRDWTMWYTDDMDGRLVQKGVDDLRHLAIRISKMFPAIMSEQNLRDGRMKFITSSVHRCVNSTLSFQAGLKELWNIKDLKLDHEENNALMRFFDQCTKFLKEVKKNPTALSEVEKFKQGKEMKSVQQNIADRLGVSEELISVDMAEAAFYMCSYEFVIKTVNSPWCQLYDVADAKVMEYALELKKFWERSYGYEINSKSSCILFHDVFNRLDQAVAEIKSGKQVTEAVTVQVGHGETLLPLFTLLGFFKDSNPLTSTNFASQSQRSFRTSRMLPHAANLVLVLYDCGGGDIRLQPLINEKPVNFPGLNDETVSMSRYQDVKNHYEHLLNGCDFATECQLS